MGNSRRNPYSIIKVRHVTEKAVTLEGLKDNENNPCVARFTKPKYVFLVDPSANKREIAQAIEEIYSEQKVTVEAVNTINVKGKAKRVRGRRGRTAGFKKAVVTLQTGDSLDNL